MGNKLRDLFDPPDDVLLEQYMWILELMLKNTNECISCIHYKEPDPYLPGFVTDYGDCKEHVDVFEDKVLDRGNHVSCETYEEDFERIRDMKEAIEAITGEPLCKHSECPYKYCPFHKEYDPELEVICRWAIPKENVGNCMSYLDQRKENSK